MNKKDIQYELILDQDKKNQLLAQGQKSFIGQVIKNILDNAISFSAEKGIIIISLSSTSNYLSISISDNGPGIKEPNVARIFDRFYSLREEEKLSNNIHSGLGLNIAKQIIDAHGGHISANNITEDNIVVGAKFIINLPLTN
jgi:two-component system sensor histidine kinase ChvG